MRDIVEMVGFLFIACLMFFLFLVLPLSWFDGHAKAAYLKQTQQIDIPWYQATFLSIEINTVDAKVQNK